MQWLALSPWVRQIVGSNPHRFKPKTTTFVNVCLHVTVDMTIQSCMLCYAHDAYIFAFICNSTYVGFERKWNINYRFSYFNFDSKSKLVKIDNRYLMISVSFPSICPLIHFNGGGHRLLIILKINIRGISPCNIYFM